MGSPIRVEYDIDRQRDSETETAQAQETGVCVGMHGYVCIGIRMDLQRAGVRGRHEKGKWVVSKSGWKSVGSESKTYAEERSLGSFSW